MVAKRLLVILELSLLVFPRTWCSSQNWKAERRVKPEDITINIGKEAKIPEPPSGHKWAEVKHDNTVAWLATWRENINGATKYVMLAATSSLKGMSDFKNLKKLASSKITLIVFERTT